MNTRPNTGNSRCLQKSMKIGYYDDRWQVISLRNSTSYLPREYLTVAIVNALCASPEWDVTIVPLDVV